MFIMHVKYFFVTLDVHSDDGQYWPKHVTAIFSIKLVAVDGPCSSVIY
jgi:hypothetical protein